MTSGWSLSLTKALLGLVLGVQLVENQKVECLCLTLYSLHHFLRTSLEAFSLWYERLMRLMSSLQHPCWAYLSANLLIWIPLCPGIHIMWIWKSGLLSRNSCTHLVKSMDSYWVGCICVQEMFEIAAVLLDAKVMDLILLSFLAICFTADMPAARVKSSPSHVLDLLPSTHAPFYTTFFPCLITVPVLLAPLVPLLDLSVATTTAGDKTISMLQGLGLYCL